ncbi:MAG: hypothetical protein ABSA09_05220 [Desulfobaccales bacterium]
MVIKILATRISFAAILVLVLTLVAAGEGGRLGTTTATQEETMMRDAAILKTGIPPIDAAAPAKTETATFALG